MRYPDITTLSLRSRILQLIRSFFAGEGYLEVEVPLLTPAPIPEHSIEVFRTEYIDRYDRSHPLFLTPSPEIYLKRLLSLGAGSLFCVSRAFRNVEQLGSSHNPEFSMLEYYTVGGDYRDSLGVTEELLAHILEGAGDELRAYRREKGRETSPAWWRQTGIPGATLKELFARHAGLDLDRLIPEQKGVDSTGAFEVLFHKALLERIEPNIPRDGPYVLWDYPRALRTLATETQDPRYAQRWELYIEGVEVANCFTEEVDPQAVAAYFREEVALLPQSRVPRPVDPEYPSIFETVPACSGVALGIDRLVAVLLGEKSIKQVMFSAFSDMIE
ncbi:MAG: amino acid--tRNA ligase-related protein [Spirochaetota bacterium]